MTILTRTSAKTHFASLLRIIAGTFPTGLNVPKPKFLVLIFMAFSSAVITQSYFVTINATVRQITCFANTLPGHICVPPPNGIQDPSVPRRLVRFQKSARPEFRDWVAFTCPLAPDVGIHIARCRSGQAEPVFRDRPFMYLQSISHWPTYEKAVDSQAKCFRQNGLEKRLLQ